MKDTSAIHTENFRITKAQCAELREMAYALDALFALLDTNESKIECIQIASLLRPIKKELFHLAGNLDLDSRRIDAPGTKKGGAHGR
jgi:hypothetical protein